MSNSDSFIDEVTEEVRRDRLYTYMRRYGWIAILLVLLIVGGAAWREYDRAQARDRAQAFGSAVLTALEPEAAEDRIAALRAIDAPTRDAAAVIAMLIAAEQGEADTAEAAETLAGVQAETDIYRQIASYKAATAAEAPAEQSRIALEALAQPGNALRLLAEERLALLDIAAGDTDAARARLIGIRDDAEVTQGLRLRAAQLIVALGGEPEAS